MKVSVGVSNRHVHLTESDFHLLFGEDAVLEKRNDISQPYQFASTSLVSLQTDKGRVDNVRVMGPFRDYTQVEISKTDAYKLGVNPPYRDSSCLDNSEDIKIIGPCGEIFKKCSLILAVRHIHVPLDDDNFNNKEVVSVKVDGDKKGILGNVFIKKSSNSKLELHLDTDDANAFNLKNGDIVEIIK